MSAVDLLPCPFCGGEARGHALPDDTFNNGGGDVIVCSTAHPDWDEHEDVFAAVNAITALRRAPVSAGKVKAREAVTEWLNESEGYSLRVERLHDDAANGNDLAPWLVEAFRMGADSALQPGDGWQGIARPIAEWHEDMGFCVWWSWTGTEWAGEPAWIGSPNCNDWPGYHTHFTPHPDMPASLPQGEETR